LSFKCWFFGAGGYAAQSFPDPEEDPGNDETPIEDPSGSSFIFSLKCAAGRPVKCMLVNNEQALSTKTKWVSE
jgi:hypothetical protein